jgi:hypothetical protein
MDPKILEIAVEIKLKEYQEMEMILLKGHLILEQTINQLIKKYVNDVNPFESMNLMFAKKILILQALIGDNFKDIFLHLKELNRIRNKVAHELFFAKYHDDLKKWACNVNGHTPKTINTKRTYKNQVIKAFAYLSGYLIGWESAVKTIKK